MKKYYSIIKIGCLILIFGCQNINRVEQLPYYKDASFTPYWIERNEKKLDDFHKISPFKLINQKGEEISNKTFENKIYVTDFFFTSCPGICPKMTENMGVVQQAFIEDPDVLLLSHSVTPQKDSVAILQRYAKEKGVIEGKWHLVTGDRSEIYSLGRNDYFVEEDLGLEKSETDFIHTENFLLIDKRGHIRGIYNGLNKRSVNQLIEDIYTLKKEVTLF